jgi:hypothetical protein
MVWITTPFGPRLVPAYAPFYAAPAFYPYYW